MKSPRPDEFTAEFYQTCKKELSPTLLKQFHKIEREGMQPNYETIITWIPKPDMSMPVSLMNINTKTLNKILINQIL
jgi:hypothetical protein